MRYIIFNSDIVYYKGSMYFGFSKDKAQNYMDKAYDNYDSAKRALRRLRKTSMPNRAFYLVGHSTPNNQGWQMASISTYTQTNFNII